MDLLQSMFPTLSISVIRSTLDRVNGQVELAVEHLLPLSDSDSKSTQNVDSGKDEQELVSSGGRKDYGPQYTWDDLESAEPKKKLIIMRGLPGSGKSTLARKLEGTKGMICSTDDLFYENGRYNFNPSKLGENHAKNKVNAEKAMQRGFSPVIIDNTNLSREEMEPYVALGIKYSYSVELREPDTSWKYDPTQLARRNSHSIQEYKIERMLERFNRDVTAEMMIKQLSKSEE